MPHGMDRLTAETRRSPGDPGDRRPRDTPVQAIWHRKVELANRAVEFDCRLPGLIRKGLGIRLLLREGWGGLSVSPGVRRIHGTVACHPCPAEILHVAYRW